MNQRDADPAAVVGQVDLSDTQPAVDLEPLAKGIREEEDFELAELLDYRSVPFQHSETRLVRFRPGSRLQPLPYFLDEENP